MNDFLLNELVDSLHGKLCVTKEAFLDTNIQGFTEIH